MTLQGYIFDNIDNTVLPGASVLVIDASGSPTAVGTAADANGYFSISSPALGTGSALAITNVGYTGVLFTPNFSNTYQAIGLDRDNEQLATATVTATVKKKNVVPWVLGGGALLLLALSGKKKKRKMGAVDPELIRVGEFTALAVGGYFLVLRPLLQKLGLQNSPEQKATLDAQKQALADAVAKAQAEGARTTPSYPTDQFTAWANDIFNLGTSGTPVSADNQDSIVHDVINVNTLIDLQQLINAFGIRTVGGGFFSLCNLSLGTLSCPHLDLPGFLRQALDSQHVNAINNFLSSTGINYVF
jgi:hypothetical protein